MRRLDLIAAVFLSGCAPATLPAAAADLEREGDELRSAAHLHMVLDDRELVRDSGRGFVCNPRKSRFESSGKSRWTAEFPIDGSSGAMRFELTPVDGGYQATSAFDAKLGYVLRGAEFALAIDEHRSLAALDFTGIVQAVPVDKHQGVGCHSFAGIEISSVQGRVVAQLPECD